MAPQFESRMFSLLGGRYIFDLLTDLKMVQLNLSKNHIVCLRIFRHWTMKENERKIRIDIGRRPSLATLFQTSPLTQRLKSQIHAPTPTTSRQWGYLGNEKSSEIRD